MLYNKKYYYLIGVGRKMKSIKWNDEKIRKALSTVMIKFYNKELNSWQVEKAFYNLTGYRACYGTIRKRWNDIIKNE